jgi:hypothetical protein
MRKASCPSRRRDGVRTAANKAAEEKAAAIKYR